METILFVINVTMILALLFSIIFTSGVVWRVEKRLDVSYKFFLAAIVCLFVAEIFNLYYSLDNQAMIALFSKVLRMFFAIFFLTGVLFMRNIIRKLDGEKQKSSV